MDRLFKILGEDRTVYGLDFDAPQEPLDPIQFKATDVRDMPFEDDSLDLVIAVSVIEHIGLENAQVNQPEQPMPNQDGDLDALREINRVLKPGGRLIMTLPYGIVEGLILGSSARCYSTQRLQSINEILEPEILEYYEYQLKNRAQLAVEHKFRSQQKLEMLQKMGLETPSTQQLNPLTNERNFGLVTWRRIPIGHTRAVHQGHSDGVICGVWRSR